MIRNLKALYQAANKNKLFVATMAGSAMGAGTAYLGHATWQGIGSAAGAGAVTAALNYIRNPQSTSGPLQVGSPAPSGSDTSTAAQ